MRASCWLVRAISTSGEQVYELVAPEEDRGFARLPEPRTGDLFFDIEGDPFLAGEGLEYLLGVTRVEGGEPVYRAFWAHDRREEKRAFETFVDFVIAVLAEDPSIHVYHYAAYESTALKRLMGRHRTREAEVGRLLGDGVLGRSLRGDATGFAALEAWLLAQAGRGVLHGRARRGCHRRG